MWGVFVVDLVSKFSWDTSMQVEYMLYVAAQMIQTVLCSYGLCPLFKMFYML